MKFLRDKINEISQKYGMPPVYKASMSIRENVLSLLNTLKQDMLYTEKIWNL